MLLAVAVLSPATLPWYVSWGMALVAVAPWTRPGAVVAWSFVSLMLVIVYYPNGEDALYNWPYLAACGRLAAAGRRVAGAARPAAPARLPAADRRTGDPPPDEPVTPMPGRAGAG